MSSSPNDKQPNPSESSSTRGIIHTITKLIERLEQQSSTIRSFLDSTPSNNNNSNNGSNNTTTGNNTNGYNNNNGDNTVTGNEGNDNTGSSSGNNNTGSSSGNNNTGSSSGNNNNSNNSNDGNNSSQKQEQCCECIWALLDKEKSSTKKRSHNGNENSNKSSSGGSSRSGGSNSDEKLCKNLSQIKYALTELKEIEEGELGKQIQIHLNSLKDFLDKISKNSTPTEFEKISKEINKLKHKIPSLKKPPSVGSGANQISQSSNESNPRRAVNGLLKNPHENESFKKSPFYKEIEEIYKGLEGDKKKFFLSCFALFPENEVVKRRLLIYWWVGEGLLEASSGTGEKAPEKIVDEFLEEFKEKGLIEPANKDRRKSTKSYRMHPLVRSAVIMITKNAGFFAYDDKGNLTANLSSSNRACLVEAEVSSKQASDQTSTTPQQQENQQSQLKTLFNVNEPYPDLKLGQFSKAKDLSVVELLLKMRKVNVLYLGRWQKSAEYHIEVDNTEFLKGLRNMKELKLLSLQGMSRINELPSSIGKLSNLMILDLKACHNLELLPDEISSLKKLRYMDVSYCYLLDHMPRGLSSLSELQVLKGFVVGNTQSGKKGTLDDLKGLKKLRKLSINNSSEGFPTPKDLEALRQLGGEGYSLRKLTIAWGALQNDELPKKQENNKCCPKLPWGGGSKQGSGEAKPATAFSIDRWTSFKRPPSSGPEQAKLPEKLEKLDLHCFPELTPPSWLNLGNLKSLKKLYVRGGRIKTLGNHQWSEVDTLCLKYLNEFKMNWRELQEKFPGLNYLEKVNCPKITFCPCDENGVWLKPKTN